MPSTPKYSRSPSPVLPSRFGDTAVAPYLTHIVTHHGQVTLVPPQTQGRVRTNKRARKVKPSQAAQEDIHAQTTSSVSHLNSKNASPRPLKARNRRRDITEEIGGPESGPGSSRAGSASGTSLENFPPPPSYESIRSDVSRIPNNDVIPLSSSSSSTDDFEDITEMDLESQWEMDRMAGFTLEERVRREWQRRQAAMARTPPTADMRSSPKSSRITRKASSLSEADLEVTSPLSPPPKESPQGFRQVLGYGSLSVCDTGLSNSLPPIKASPRRSGTTSPITSRNWALGNIANSSKSSLEDWDVLEPVRSGAARPSSSHSFQRPTSAPFTEAITATSLQDEGKEFSRSPSEPSSTVASLSTTTDCSGQGPGREHIGCHKPHPSRRNSNASLTGSLDAAAAGNDPPSHPETPSFENASLPRVSYKGKEREVDCVAPDCNLESHGTTLSAIHRRPLPTPPTPTPFDSTPSTSCPSILPAGSSPFSTFPDQPIAGPSRPAPSASSSVRDRISKFESMRNRPIPPPPADFLSKTRIKRKPPPIPPSSYRHGTSEPGRGDLENEVRPHSISAKREPTEGTEDPPASSTSRNTSPGCSGQDLHQPLPPGIQEMSHAPCLPAVPSELRGSSPSVSGSKPGPPSCVEPHAPNMMPCITASIVEDLSINGEDSVNLCRPLDPTEVVQSAAESIPQEIPEAPAGSPGQSTAATVSAEAILLAQPAVGQSERDTSLSAYTDLDVLLSRLDDASSGNRYDDLLVVSDILGPAQPQFAPSATVGDLPVGRIEVMRRRKLQDGRVKLKLSLLGVVVDRCGVCLSQFKHAEWAVLLPCLHPFHSTCLRSWLARSHTCPLCRVALDTVQT